MTEPGDPLIGQPVGSYRIERLIGQGGMGRVYAAVQPEVGSRVAIKVLNEEYARDQELIDRLFAEARAAVMIAHENIVDVLDLVKLPDGRPAIVMELLEGRSLRELVREGTTPMGAVVHVMSEVLSALAAAHAVGIVHRDLKPDNILVTPGGRAKVLDFGIAKLAHTPPGVMGPRTRTGAVLGTPEYMAPEQITGGHVDARTDLYAAGIVLFEALTGKRPFAGPSDFEVMRAHVDLLPPSPRALRPDLPLEIEHVILCALEKEPGRRFANATAMANALQAASATLPPPEWRSFTPHGRSYLRPTPLSPPATRTSAMQGEHSGALPTARELPSPRQLELAATLPETPRRNRSPEVDDARTRRETPSARGSQQQVAADGARRGWLSHLSPRDRWLLSGFLVVGVATIIVSSILSAADREDGRDTRGSGHALAHDAEVVASTDASVAPLADAAAAGPPTRIERPATYDPRRFDPVALYPHALELARTFVPDAELMFVKSVPAVRDGTVDLTAASDGRQNVYLYRSPAPPGPDGQRVCVGVEPWPAKIVAFVYPSKDCEYPLVSGAPRCTLAQVWARAQKQRPFTAHLAHVGFFGEVGGAPYWYVDPSLGMRTGAGVRVEDDCRTATKAPTDADRRETRNAWKGEIIDTTDDDADDPPAEDKPSGQFFEPFDAATFDPIRYIPTARALARRLEDDAELIEISLQPVHRDGSLEVHKGGGARFYKYHFRSAKRGAPKRPPRATQCEVVVEMIGGKFAAVARKSDDSCTSPFVRAPRCTVRQIWDRAAARGAVDLTDEGVDTLIGWRGRWEFVGTNADRERLTFEFADDCR